MDSITAMCRAQGYPEIGCLLIRIMVFIDSIVVPFIMAIAFIVFIWGVFQYFIAGGADEEKRKQGRDFVMWGLIGFVIIISLWGLVNLLMNSLGFRSQTRPPLPIFGAPPGFQTQNQRGYSNPFDGANVDGGTASRGASGGGTGNAAAVTLLYSGSSCDPVSPEQCETGRCTAVSDPALYGEPSYYCE